VAPRSCRLKPSVPADGKRVEAIDWLDPFG
jgi:hypothetical protein